MAAVKANVVYYTGGYGYEIKPSSQSEVVLRSAAKFLQEYQQDIDWVVNEFGGWNSSDLELASTVIYVDREAISAHESLQIEDLVQRVKAIKPRFSEEQIRKQAERLLEKELIGSIR